MVKYQDPPLSEADAQSLQNARTNAGIGPGGADLKSGAPEAEGGSGGNTNAEETTERVGAAPTASAPAQVSGTQPGGSGEGGGKTTTRKGASSNK